MGAEVNKNKPPHVIVVGGGAGGIELATRLGDSLGRRDRAVITLVDKSATHIWKPLLHEVAAGSMDIHQHQLDYLAQARWHHFRFQFGALESLDRAAKTIQIAAVEMDGSEMLPRRTLPYDLLVIAVGSTINHFDVPGAAEHTIALDSSADADRLHRRLVAACVRANARSTAESPAAVEVAIIGGGATGVELAAEIRSATRVLAAYGLDNIDPPRDVHLTIIEANPRLLPALPERIAEATEELLKNINVSVLNGEKVTEVGKDFVATASGKRIKAEIAVWAAGIKAPDFLTHLEGLESNRFNQLVVGLTLQTTHDPGIFAIGDCAACPWPQKDTADKKAWVPPRAQAAHQQASLLAKNIERYLDGKPLKDFRYRDFGSLVSVSEFSAVGTLMGALIGGSIFVEGLLARLMYESLYKMHLLALHGFFRTALEVLSHFIRNRTEPQVKLH
ncbi:MAG: NAD(P)/FAD-dependent oxidoreductase [Burkholderiales bacterium]|nr:NAD(P)/FAD-dependent oxidoreductase [Burkholderiales bacterium]